MKSLSRPWLTIAGAAIAALLLTLTRPSPKGLLGLGLGNRVVRAAPGQTIKKDEKHNLAALEIVNRTLIRIQQNYVDPSRIDPKEMLYSALDSVQRNIPEVLVEPDRVNNQVVVHVNEKIQSFSVKKINAPWSLSKTLKQVFRFIEANINDETDLVEVEYAATNGILSTLDPHSILLDPEQAREMNVSTGGGFSGLGIIISMKDQKLIVIKPMPGTPAHRVGLLPKDIIVKINEETTENLTLSECMSRMRGKRGTKVVVWIQRKKEKNLKRFEITRDRIQVASVESKMLSKKVGYIKIKQFSSPTTKETKKALQSLTKQGATSFVLDLRSNPGGLLQQAIRVSDLFLDRGTIVTTVSGKEREAHRASLDKTVLHAPLAILINGNSASASEIVAGALKNLDRAITIGSTSFGKGSVQILYDNKKDGSTLKLTIAQYLTPGDLSIQGGGIAPDIALQRMHVPKQNKKATDYLRLLPPSKKYKEKDLKASLKSNYAVSKLQTRATVRFVYEAPDEDEDEDEIREDFEIRFARNYLATYGKKTRKASLKNLEKALMEPRAEQRKKLQAKLMNLGVDWSSPPIGQAQSILQAHFKVEGNRTTIKAGETIKLIGTLSNTGPEPVFQALAKVQSQDYAFIDTEFPFGKILPGESKSWTTLVKIRGTAVDRLDHLTFLIQDAAGTKVVAEPLQLQIQAAVRPTFAYSHQLLDQGNQDGLIQRGETHKLRLTVRNVGKGISKKTTALLRNVSGADIKLTKARFSLDTLNPNDERTIEFAFDVAPKTKANIVVVELQVYDKVLGESVVEKLRFPIFKNSGVPQVKSSLFTLQSSAAIYEGANLDSAIIAYAEKGTVFRVSANIKEWHRIELPGKRPGFLLAKTGRKSSDRINMTGLKLHMQTTPPVLRLTIPAYETTKESYILKGNIQDDNKVEDVYIFISNQKSQINNRKVFYQSNHSGARPKELSFEAKLPLWPGSNAVTVVTRENDKVHTIKTFYLNRVTEKTISVPAN